MISRVSGLPSVRDSCPGNHAPDWHVHSAGLYMHNDLHICSLCIEF